MVSIRLATIIAIAAFASGGFIMSPVPQAIAAVIATDVQCTGCVGTPDLAGNAVTAAKIKDGEVKAAEIATNAVGASEIATDAVGGSELIGVTKLLFGRCVPTSDQRTTVMDSNDFEDVNCTISGVDSDDSVVANLNLSVPCFYTSDAVAETNNVQVVIVNGCSTPQAPGLLSSIAVIVYDK